ncbi:MAG: ABC transporter ATP-binding protein [Ilumatobacter sp.]|nr:ABC transporter ATP-binding protein [Ilumatobacter sp.]
MSRNNSGPHQTRHTLYELLRTGWWQWVALSALVVLGSSLTILGPVIVRSIVDSAAAGVTASEVTRLAAAFLAVAVGSQIVTVFTSWFATVLAWKSTNELRISMTRHILDGDFEFQRSHTPGELIQRIDGDITSVSEFLSKVVTKIASVTVLVVGMVAVLSIFDWRLGVGMTVYVAATFAAVLRGRQRSVVASSEEMAAVGQLYGGIEERLTASEDLRSNGAADYCIWRLVEDSEKALVGALRRQRAFLSMYWFVQGAVAAGWVLALILGAVGVQTGFISLGTAFLLFQYVLLISRPLEEVARSLETVQKANGAMVRVTELMSSRPTIADEGVRCPLSGPLAVDVRDVTFAYSDSNPVLCNVDVHVAAGRSVGIVGRTGCGKTTFSRLILRLVEPTSGVVLLGGVPAAEIPLTELRRRVALVPQEVELFAGSLRDNVALFDARMSDRAVIDALQHVGLKELADGGVNQMLGAGGVELSAGEAQLLAFARVWLRDPDLLILDEATARVDPETEQRLEAAISELTRGRTTLIIAHRLSTLRAVDEIIVFESGRVVEHGDQADLVGDDSSRFAQLLSKSAEKG